VLPRGNRTFICSVVFIDIVEYSRKAVAEQIRLKEQLNSLLAEALRDVAANDRVILDTGDGAAISFVGDPEDALFVCIALRDAVTMPPPGVVAPLQMRIGINLGPVKLVQDLNGQPNIIGDGINVAQRIMGFAEPNQILVARSYYEVVSCLSDAYAKLFHYEGSRTDKHVREHEVYAVGDSTVELKLKYEADRPALPRLIGSATTSKAVIDHLTHFPSRVTENLRTRPQLGTALAVVAILVTAVALRGMRDRPAAPMPSEPVRPIAAATRRPWFRSHVCHPSQRQPGLVSRRPMRKKRPCRHRPRLQKRRHRLRARNRRSPNPQRARHLSSPPSIANRLQPPALSRLPSHPGAKFISTGKNGGSARR